MTRVLVVGTTGMLGAMVHDWLRRDPSLVVSATARDVAEAVALGFAGNAVSRVDAEAGETPDLTGIDWVINCVGIIKPYIRDDDREQVRRAIAVNSLFPMRLADAAERSGSMVLQIATDCVYSGRDGCYDETAPHDATDVYGKTKGMGEVTSSRVRHLRCSIIGPQFKGKDSLLSWFLKQERGAALSGYRNHHWNGVTTLHYARLCAAIITREIPLPHVQHVVPGNDITKADLLRTFAREFDRSDVTITDVDARPAVDRRVRTTDMETNRQLWSAAGYDTPPTVEAMVHEMANHRFHQ